LGRAQGAELPEDDLLGWLRAQGLITYPSPLLAPLLDEWPDVLAAEVLCVAAETHGPHYVHAGGTGEPGDGGILYPVARGSERGLAAEG
jgi:hypothetical protein